MNDPFVICPYNNQHTVPQSRIQRHIVKCEKKYPPLAICPYNATHRLSHDLLKAHVDVCPSKENFPLDWKPFHTNALLLKPRENKLSVDDFDEDDWD